MTVHISANDLTILDAEPRVQDLRLAEALGFDRHRKIRELIRRNRAELGDYGEVFASQEPAPPHGGAPSEAFWLNEPQALLTCMFARTDNAAAVRRSLIEVFMEWRRTHANPAPGRPLGNPDADFAGAFGRQEAIAPAAELEPLLLNSKLKAVAIARSVFGKMTAQALWTELGLPFPAAPALPPERAVRAEAGDVLKRLLEAVVDPDSSETVRQLLIHALDDQPEAAAVLQSHAGIAVLEDEGRQGFLVANSHPRLTRLFAGTRWSGDWFVILRRLPGTSSGHRFSPDGVQRRGTFIPAAYLDPARIAA